jgi:Peptidase family M1 domain
MNALIFAAAAALMPQTDTAYFQQGVDYRIEARLDEETDVLSARARLRYRNESQERIDTLFFHLHLNAFRPNSAWARRDLEFDNRRFTDLGPAEHAFERLKSVTIGGTAVTPIFPGAPDSTVVALPLPRPLAPGDSTVVRIDWDARTSTLPRRQGRRGRHFDFAQWYPRIAVFDRGGWQVQPLMPQGEFYGEFGAFDVTMDVAADQVIGATGVPVEGDPGWAGAQASGAADPIFQRDAYAARPAEDLGFLSAQPEAGRKRVRWRAEDVHHFAWTTNPEYIYEGGSFEDVAIHVLYQPGDTAWDDGVAVRRTASTLAFLDTIFGDFPWPQITNVHRIEGGGTEFPMMVMDGSASEGLIMHEVGHNYVHGIFGNNEWREGWLDEGFSSFLTNWYFEAQGQDPQQLWGRSLEGIRALERAGETEPIALASADFSDFSTYNAMTYTKPSLVYRMLRWLMGEARFRQGLRHYFEHNALQHVREADLEASMEAAYGQDLDWFFDQWIHTTDTLDYRLGDVTTTQRVDGRWDTRIEIVRAGDIWMPVDLRVGTETRRIEGRERTQVVTITTATRPDEVVLDPDAILIETDVDNNSKSL